MRCLSVDGRTVGGPVCPSDGRGFKGGGASCSQRGREGHRCCWWEDLGGPGTTATRPGLPVRAAAVVGKKNRRMSGRVTKKK